MIDLLGWVATAVFVGSYFCTRAAALRRLQVLGAFLWVGYGVLLSAPPVIAANLLVMAAAAWTSRRTAPEEGAHRHAPTEHLSHS
ncbi:MAG TPA: hypothetical protein VK939_16340 [Longimicrobiales bacterium]|nr:hypothetical protein [Longimicrobiales bacterium]